MAQFDVHRNKGTQKDSIPFVVVVQSARFDAYRRRVVVPLVLRQNAPAGASISGSRMNPIFSVAGVEVVLNPLQTASVALDQLGAVDEALEDHGQPITDAMDDMMNRAWG
jgi:toxin CcdB